MKGDNLLLSKMLAMLPVTSQNQNMGGEQASQNYLLRNKNLRYISTRKNNLGNSIDELFYYKILLTSLFSMPVSAG